MWWNVQDVSTGGGSSYEQEGHRRRAAILGCLKSLNNPLDSGSVDLALPGRQARVRIRGGSGWSGAVKPVLHLPVMLLYLNMLIVSVMFPSVSINKKDTQISDHAQCMMYVTLIKSKCI